MKRVKIGIVGCGNISGIYLQNLTGMFKDIVELVAVCDIIPERATAAKEKWNVPRAYFTDEEFFAQGDIELVVNLTTPLDHKAVNMMALKAGKHAYCEKPLAVTRDDGIEQLSYARSLGLYLGGAPDTFLGGGIQTCRKLIDDGWIGTPVAATAFMTCHGHESWHPDPEFYYQVGGGPMFDMGPYYLTAMINLLGGVKTVSGTARRSFETRTVTSEKKFGKIVDVEVPTYVAGLLGFESGAVGTIITTFDVWAAQLPRIEIYGETGTISVPDPNTFGGPVRLYRAGSNAWEDVPVVYGYQENSRGLGVADMACAIARKTSARAGITQTMHTLDIMCAIHDASNEGRTITLKSAYERQPILPLGLRDGQL